jgi:hypothetical protein
MENPQPKNPAPDVPSIQKCPRCGNNILIGDKRCSRCGLNVTPINDIIRDIPPRYVLLVGGALGFVILLMGFGFEGGVRAFFLLLGAGIGGGAWVYFVGMTYIFNDPKRRRRKLR